MGNLFNYDNKFFEIINKIVDCFFAGTLWILFSIPVITFGASTTAFYYTVHKSLRGNRGYIWRSFWGSFKSNFKQATKIWMILFVIFIFFITDSRITYQYLEQGAAGGALYYFFYFAIVFEIVWCVYIFAYSARFESGIKDTMKNAAIIAFVNLPWSLLILLLLVLGVVAVYVSPIMFAFAPAGVSCLLDALFEKVFQKYMVKEDVSSYDSNDTE